MDIFALILTCAVAGDATHHTRLYQIAQTTDQNAVYVDDLTAAKVYAPPRRDTAAQITRELIEQNHDVRVGLTQVPADTAVDDYAATPAELVTPCDSVAYGSQHLQQARSRYPDSPRKALSWYFTGDGTDPLGVRWASEVLGYEAVDVEQAATHPGSAPPSENFSAPDSRMFPSNRMTESDSTTPDRPKAKQLFTERPTDPEPDSPASDAEPKSSPSSIEKFDAPDSSSRPAANSEETQKPRDRSSSSSASSGSEGKRTVVPESSTHTSAKKRLKTEPTRMGDGGPYPPVTDERIPPPDAQSKDEASGDSSNSDAPESSEDGDTENSQTPELHR